MRLLLSMLVSLLPEYYRRRASFALQVDPIHGAIVSGAIQSGFCTIAFCYGYLAFLQHRVGQFAEMLIGRSAEEAMGSTVCSGARE